VAVWLVAFGLLAVGCSCVGGWRCDSLGVLMNCIDCYELASDCLLCLARRVVLVLLASLVHRWTVGWCDEIWSCVYRLR